MDGAIGLSETIAEVDDGVVPVHRLAEEGTVENEGVKFPILSTGIN